MPEREQKSGGAIGCFILGAVALMLLPLYVLSIGPVAWLVERNPSLEYIGIIYAPIGFLADACQPIEDALMWYMELWRG